MTRRATFGRARGFLAPISLGVLAAAACQDFDGTRTPPQRGSLGVELYGVVCDRVGAQSLPEDLSGTSYSAICHGEKGDGVFGPNSTKVNTAALPPITGDAPTIDGGVQAADQQNAGRTYAIERLERLAADRANLVAALDATFPNIKIPVKNLTASDPTQSCAMASAEGSLHAELANFLGRLTALYDDGTLPASTESLGSVVQAFKASGDAQTAWTRFNQRHGYRLLDTAVGAARPVLAYSDLRGFAAATLKLLAPDSDPFAPNPMKDANGNRVPVPGAAYPQMQALMSAASAELKNETADPDPNPYVLGATADPTFGNVLNRPMMDLEALQSVLFHADPAFAKGPYAIGGAGSSPPQYIVQRDPRGIASVTTNKGALPTPFVADPATGLPQIDALGAFVTSDHSTPPTPFPTLNPDTFPRDTFGRPMIGSAPLYGYIDTNQTFLSVVMGHARGAIAGKSLFDANSMDGHETMMDALAGAYVLFGSRAMMTREYADGSSVAYNGFQPQGAPIGDLVYALGQILADPSADATLAFASSIFRSNPNDLARLVGDILWIKGQADMNTTAKIPAQSTFWDEMLDLLVQIAEDSSTPNGARLLEDVLTAFADPVSLKLSAVMQSQSDNKDHISYDRANLNGPAVNLTSKNKTDPPDTPVDRSMPDTGANRSNLQRFAQLVHDTNGQTACNKEGATLQANLGNGTVVTVCNPQSGGNTGSLGPSDCSGQRAFHECEVFKIDNLAAFYLDSIVGKANLYMRNQLARDGLLSIGKTTVGVLEQSSGIGFHSSTTTTQSGSTCTAFGGTPDDTYNSATNVDQSGFWDSQSSTTLRPKPGWLSRLIYFDQVNDSPKGMGTNCITNTFLSDLQGMQVGTTACKPRVIPDPCWLNGAVDPACFESSAGAASADVAASHTITLSSCNAGDWLAQRDGDVLFDLEADGFLDAIQPLAKAFTSHGREDLFLQLMEVINKHWQTAAGAAAEPDDCLLTTDATGKTTTCSKDGADTYEPILATMFGSDLLSGLNNLANIAKGIHVTPCAKIDPTTHACTTPGAAEDGIQVLAATLRALVDPKIAASYGLTDSTGKATAPRNDGTTNPQVTPAYLLLDALDEMDQAFANDKNDPDTNRQAQWRSARSQLVDEILGVNGENTAKQTFQDPSFPLIAPVVVDTLRAQLLARCGSEETTGKCAWARGTLPTASCPPGMVSGLPGTSGCAVPTALWNEAVASMGGPLFATAMDVVDAIRNDGDARTEFENLVAYLSDPTKTDSVGAYEALAELLTTGHDVMQTMRDDTNIVPLYKVLSAAFTAPAGPPPPGLSATRNAVDASTALLTRLAGKALDANGHEICAKEIDPNNVIDIALAHLVTPMTLGTGGDGGAQTGETPLEVIVDTIADVNRAPMADPTTPLQQTDYANISNEVNQFLVDPDRGLEQFYAIVRNATEH